MIRQGKIMQYAVLLIITMAAMSALAGCRKENISNQYQVSDREGTAVNHKSEIAAVVREIDLDAQAITVLDTAFFEDITLSYNGGADIRNKYNEIISISTVSVGEIVEVEYDENKSKLKSLKISEDAWEYQGVNKFSFDKTKKSMKIANKKYQYTDNLLIFSEGEEIPLIDVSEKDELTVRGMDGDILSIVVTEGHGFVRLTGYDSFLGGTLEIGYREILPVTENMMVVVREGTYKLTMTNGELVGTKSISVIRDKEITVDMSEFIIPAERIGEVEFLITPDGADLYINNILTDYSEPVKLNYGEHKIKVSLSGYEDFYGIMIVGEASQRIELNLAAEEPAEADDDILITIEGDEDEDTSLDWDTDSVSEAEANEAEESDTEASSTTEKVDSLHKVTVKAPEGVEVYLDGTYKGISPVSFTKTIGKYTIMLKKEGYVSKSYSVDFADDSEDVFLSFPALLEE
ncbi:PEGA domain-containing protein [Anaeromicropila populeti]|uniref:PEGA domain-containing protein n=1 Tax=Anaeromicropila populeti TaxID=37658 RepID=A0A1I6I6U2_9FIRM|nr:PEGA domain-containing protein [Anaeromicropila populeti]SFR62110.1 PEGA domain-containing protein [Anaeromicropila populeti]